MNNPSAFIPSTLGDFVGPARQVGGLLQKLIDRGGSHCVLLKGPPGTGKTALARWFCRQLAGPLGEFNIIQTNGTKVNVEAVDGFLQHVQYLSHGARCILIDEADAIPAAAQVRILTFLDHVRQIRSSSHGCAVIATSNDDFQHFPERLQTRFRVFEVPGPTEPELRPLLARFTPGPAFAPLAEIIRLAGGNVRQALVDLDTALLAA